MREPKVKIGGDCCCWRCMKPAGRKVKAFYKRLKSKGIRRSFKNV